MHVLQVDASQGESSGLDEQLQSFWELELLGIHDKERTLLDDFATTVKFEDGRYKVTRSRTHYLPHHTVVHHDKLTTKLHIVYDASAGSNDSPSLNDCLQKGPKFNQLVLDLLM